MNKIYVKACGAFENLNALQAALRAKGEEGQVVADKVVQLMDDLNDILTKEHFVFLAELKQENGSYWVQDCCGGLPRKINSNNY